MYTRAQSTAAISCILAFVAGACGQTPADKQTSTADIPLPVLTNGKYVHSTSVTTQLISIGTDGLILECKSEQPAMLWREHYAASGSQIRLDAILRPIVISTTPLSVRWDETKIPTPAGTSYIPDGRNMFSPEVDATHPQPRAEQRVRPAVFPQGKPGTVNIGLTSVDQRWSNYGVYLQRLIESVQVQWERILSESGVYPNPGSIVEVKFLLNSRGEVAKILQVNPSLGTSDAATRACPAAIEARAPYGDWTDDMINMLGTEQQMTFTFLYQ